MVVPNTGWEDAGDGILLTPTMLSKYRGGLIPGRTGSGLDITPARLLPARESAVRYRPPHPTHDHSAVISSKVRPVISAISVSAMPFAGRERAILRVVVLVFVAAVDQGEGCGSSTPPLGAAKTRRVSIGTAPKAAGAVEPAVQVAVGDRQAFFRGAVCGVTKWRLPLW